MSQLRPLSHHGVSSVKDRLAALVDFIPDDMKIDVYGKGDAVESLEREVADLLGKEAGVFMPSGTMAQQIAMRIHTDNRHSKVVAFHPTCHLEIHEQQGYHLLHGLNALLLGSQTHLFTLHDLQQIQVKIGALLIEIPQREIGGQLPEWDDLLAITAYARSRQIPVHMDGARLWESQPFYGRSHAEIADLFDSVYVSFYKGLGGIAGAILAGEKEFIDQARIWQRRHGGNLPSLYPYSLAAQQALRQRLPRMNLYYQRTQEIAAILRQFPQIRLIPNVPQTNMTHLYLRGDNDTLLRANEQVKEQLNIELFRKLLSGVIPDSHYFELVIGDAALTLANESIQAAFELLFQIASSAKAS